MTGRAPAAHNFSAMSENDNNNIEDELSQLEKRIEDLLAQLEKLRNENFALRARQETMSTERASLLRSQELARTRVEAIIGQLKTLEHNA
ncbi:MAG: TIGR02449 family protein [Steroidobacteraceae bacterium]|nr:TIGR02449 family protein [Steroidobacteraceae bacterium]MDW8257958.1 TIGR02449 family protein [Gammaproteobacteria bacterium]